MSNDFWGIVKVDNPWWCLNSPPEGWKPDAVVDQIHDARSHHSLVTIRVRDRSFEPTVAADSQLFGLD